MLPAPGGDSKYGEKVNILSIQLHLLLSVILHQKWVQLSFQSQIHSNTPNVNDSPK